MRRWLSVLAMVLVVAVTPAGLRAQEIFVLITQPAVNQSIFGEQEIVADVTPEGVSARVEFWVDGELSGTLQEPPYRMQVDVGQDNREHRLEVRAFAEDGQSAEAVLVTPAIAVDEVVQAELQQLYVTVVGNQGRVLDLVESDFEIRDQGTVEEMVTFTAGHVQLAAAVLIDASVSMRGRRLRFAMRGATAFASGVEDEDEVSIQLFADRLLYESPFSSDIRVSTAGLAGVEAEGGTAMNDHLYRALRQLEEQQGRRVVVLLSDGIDTHSVLKMRDVAWLARRSRAMIYWVRTEEWEITHERYSAWKGNDEYRREYALLEETVEATGGRILTLDSVEQAEGAMREILAELREQYVLGYYPSLSLNDGSWHKVNVRVTRPGTSVRARGGYIDY